MDKRTKAKMFPFAESGIFIMCRRMQMPGAILPVRNR